MPSAVTTAAVNGQTKPVFASGAESSDSEGSLPDIDEGGNSEEDD